MTFTFEAIGTQWVIDIYSELADDAGKSLLAKITDRIAIFDQAYSRFRDDSIVTAMSRTAARYTLPDDAERMFALYRKMYDLTGGLFTPMIGDVLSDAGYDAKYSLVQKKPLVVPPSWDEAFTYAHPYIDVHIPVLLDFGAAGKGYLIDLVGELLRENGIESFCVDAGGDMSYHNVSGERLKVGLEHPADPTKVIGTIEILNESLCGSAGNRRAWGKFHHVINPQSLESPRHIAALWVTAADTITADALTTALYFVSPEKLKQHFDFEYCIVRKDFSYEKSEGFNATMFT